MHVCWHLELVSVVYLQKCGYNEYQCQVFVRIGIAGTSKEHHREWGVISVTIKYACQAAGIRLAGASVEQCSQRENFNKLKIYLEKVRSNYLTY